MKDFWILFLVGIILFCAVVISACQPADMVNVNPVSGQVEEVKSGGSVERAPDPSEYQPSNDESYSSNTMETPPDTSTGAWVIYRYPRRISIPTPD